jgi:hypothetical protein
MQELLSTPQGEATAEDAEDRAETAAAIDMSNDQEQMTQQVMTLTGCSRLDASEALDKHGNKSSAATEWLLWGLMNPLYEHDHEVVD